MFVLSEETLICSSRRKPSPEGDAAITGHNWRIVASVTAEALDERGEVLPQGRLREMLWQVAEPLDHRHLNDLSPFAAPPGPTPARIALHIWTVLEQLIGSGRVGLLEVAVWTSSTECSRVRAPHGQIAP
jgi:6-pyruvoyl-tetrahydropterin synthase